MGCDLFPACFRNGSADLMNVKALLTHWSLFFDHVGPEGEGATIFICPKYGNCYPFLSCGRAVALERAV